MADSMTLRKFLAANTSETVFTHTGLKGGKFFIKDEDLPRFYDLYTESILDGDHVHLVEKNTQIGSLRVDFDFIYKEEIQTHQHTQDQVVNFCKAYMESVAEYLQLPPKIEIYVMEKRKPTLDKKNNRMKSGIHIVVPDICTTSMVEQSVRRNLLKTVASFFPDLPLTEKWEKVYDEAVVKRSVNWMLYGSRKGDDNSRPYETKYIINYENGNVSINTNIPAVTPALIQRLSVRRQDEDETPMTEKGKATYGGIPEVRISGGRAVTPARGRPAVRTDKPGSRTSSPAGRIVRTLEPVEKEYLKDHTMNLKLERATGYTEWLQVGLCLHNIHPDLLDVFLDFSAQYEEKFNEADCIQKWNGMTFRNDGDRVGLGTLRFWSRTDNPDGYSAIESSNVERLIVTACSGTEHDVASLIYAKFRDSYKCSDFGKNVWYRWSGHIWSETDCGIDLQLKLSKEIAQEFFKRANRMGLDLEGKQCTTEGKGDCGVCEYCQRETQRMGFMKMYTKLKTTTFKNNVMKECRELFFDEQFTKKVDATKELIAFNNGVLDMTDTSKFVFRNGLPEDYISFSTEIDYDPDRAYYDYPEWPAIQSFINQVLPDPEVRLYFIRHLATCLMGGNKAQKFHILTGSGSNGKSMLMNLVSKALGDYAAVVPISLFTQKRGKSGAAAPEVIRLKGRRFVTMQEPDEKIALNTGLMKEISSCEKMYARDLFKSGCEFEVQAKFHLACNEKPEINTTDGGTWRRLVVVNYTSKFVDKPCEPHHYPIDETIQASVISKDWATPFLNYLVTILKEGNGFHKLPTPTKVLEYTSEYRNDTDGIARFLSEKTEEFKAGDEVQPVLKAQLQSVFKQWKMANENLSLSVSDLVKRVTEKYGKYPAGGWTNFRLSD
jgi:P4 family phage/plasmid primase-like protien